MVGFLPFEPAMCISSMDEVELSPCKWRARSSGGALGTWLHPPHVTNVSSMAVFTT